jgi:CMP/dCMP kinase
MILTISGMPGSGKTSVGKLIAAQLGVPFYSVGGLRGKMAEERGISIDELNRIGEQDPTTDTTVDAYTRELGTRGESFVIEGRLAWHFIPQSFKVFLNCDLTEAGRRIYAARHGDPQHDRHDEPLYDTPEHAAEAVAARIASDVRRYQKYYNLDYRDPHHYDLVIDTTTIKGPGETAERVLEKIKNMTP